MQGKAAFILAFIGLWCVIDVQSQAIPPASDWRQFLPKNLPVGATKIIDAAFKLQTDLAAMRNSKKYDAVLIKADIQAIVDAAGQNGIVLSAETKTKIDEFNVVLDKMIVDKKFDPKVLREGVFGILRSLRPGGAGTGPIPTTAATTKAPLR